MEKTNFTFVSPQRFTGMLLVFFCFLLGSSMLNAQGDGSPCETPDVEVTMVMKDMFTVVWNANMADTDGHFFNLKVLGCGSLGGILDLADVYEVEGLDADQAPDWPGADAASPKTLYVDGDGYFRFVVDGLSPCACYDVIVNQICDDWIDTGNLGVGGFYPYVKTFKDDAVCSVVGTETDDVCTDECDGYAQLKITGGPCFGDRYVKVEWESDEGANGEFVEQTNKEHFDLWELCYGEYDVTVTICDEGVEGEHGAGSVSGNCKETTCSFTIVGVDEEAPVFELALEDDANGPDETSNENPMPDAENTLPVGDISLPSGTCVVDIDFSIDWIRDNCPIEDLEVGAEIIEGDATVELIPNDDNPGEYIILVHAGPGDGTLKVYVKDQDNTAYAFATWSVEDNTAPSLITPGTSTFDIPECATTTCVYFDIQGSDCTPVYLWAESAGLGIEPVVDGQGNIRSFYVCGVGVGEYTVTAYADDDLTDDTDPVSQDFTVRVIAGGTDDGPIIIGPGQIMKTIPVCEHYIDAAFDIFVVDDCNEGAVITDVSISGGATVEGGPTSFTVSDLEEGTYTVTAKFDGADDYTFDIVVMSAGPNNPAVIVAASENVTIPQCEPDDLVYYTFQVIDDCEEVDLLDVTIGGGFEIISRNHQNGDNWLVGEFTATADLAFGVYDVEITYGDISTTVTVAVNGQVNETPVVTVPGNSNFTILPCEDEVAATIGFTISDDCDNFGATAGNATFSFRGAAIAPDFTNPGGIGSNSAYYEFNVVLSKDDDGEEFVASYTDGAGQEVTQSILLAVNSQEDDIAPVIVYPAVGLTADLDPCSDAPAIFHVETTAVDNCDGDVATSLSIDGGASTATVVSLGGQRWMIVADPGDYTVTVTATDAAGNERKEDFTIKVTRDPAPLTNLGCNDNVNVTLNGECEALVVPDMVLEGEFGCLVDGNFEIVVVDSDPSNGAIVDGCGDFIYEITYQPLAGGNVDGFTGPFGPENWTFNVDDAQMSAGFVGGEIVLSNTAELPGAFEFDYFATAAVTMPSGGDFSFDWSFRTAESSFGTIEFELVAYQLNTATGVTEEVLASDGDEGINTGGGEVVSGTETIAVESGDVFVFVLRVDDVAPNDAEAKLTNVGLAGGGFQGDPGDFTTCWGYIHADDKEDPVIECPADTDQATLSDLVQNVSGAIAATDPSINTADHTCFLEAAPNPPSGDHFYDLYAFEVTEDDVYTFLLNSQFSGATFNDGSAAIYQGSFDPSNPCENIIGHWDDNAPGFQPGARLALPLRKGETYILLTTTYEPDVFGSYTWDIFADGDGAIKNLPIQPITVTRDLICDDVDYVLLTAPEMYVVDRDGATVPGTMSDNLREKLNYTGRPTISDNCGYVKVTVSDELQENGTCGDVVITRTFYIEDKYNSDCSGAPNTAVCTQRITIGKPALADVIFPPFTAFVECDEDFPTLDNGNPAPSLTGYPFLQTAFGFEDLDDDYCNLGASFEDRPSVDICEGTYKFFREWSVFDWCDPTTSGTFLQLIKVGDYTPPVVECPLVDYDWDGEYDLLTYSTGPFDCTGAFQVPLPTVTDNCSGYTIYTEIVTDIEVDVVDQYGRVIGTELQTIIVRSIGPDDSRYVSGIPYGQHRFRYIVSDNCGNERVVECDFQVVDKVEPTAICDDELNVSIGGQDLARVYKEDIDEGSHDNCGVATIKVRRTVDNILDEPCLDHFDYDGDGIVLNDEITLQTVEIDQQKYVTPWLDYVDFLCCDVGEEVTVELGVWDEYGNFNVCWLVVTPEDKVRPYCYAPHNVAIDCDDLPYDFDPTDLDLLSELFDGVDGGGNVLPSGQDNCAVETINSSAVANLDDCGFGTIIRTFSVVDINGNTSTNTCRQVITVNEVHNYEICFPKDAEANCGVPDVDTLYYNEIGCDLLAVSRDTQFFSASGDECYKMFITYSVINWCEYDGEAPPVVIGRDEDCDDNEPGYKDEPNGIYVLVRPNGVTYLDRDTDENNDNPNRFEDCFPDNETRGHWTNSDYEPRLTSRGYWEYTQHVRVYDNEDPVVAYPGTDPFCSEDNETCDAPVSVPFSVTELCTPDDLEIKIFLDANADGIIDAQLTNADVLTEGARDGNTRNFTISGTFPIGNHAFEVHVLDGCRRSDAAVIPFSVIDCKAPSPICISVLAVELMPADLDGDGVFDEGAMAVWANDFVNSPIFDCSEPIKISINRAGETPDIDQTSITVTCDDAPGPVTAEVHAWDAAGNNDFCEVFIDVQDNMGICGGTGSIAGRVFTEEDNSFEGGLAQLSGGMNADVTTTVDGDYAFNGLQPGGDYTVALTYDLDHVNGVSTFDLVLMSKHILGVKPLDSPYKLIAADANNSNTITTLDLIQLRKLILGIDSRLQNSSSWVFVDARHVFPDPTNPFASEYPQVISINNLPEGATLGQDFIAVKKGDVNGSARANSRMQQPRNVAGLFAFDVADQELAAGNEYTVDFTAADMANIQGYQLTLMLDNAIELVDVVYGVATEDNFGMRFLDEGAVTMSWNGEASAEDVLFSLVVRANADAQLSELLGVSSRYTTAEAYTTGNEQLDVAINFSTGTIADAKFELYQNTPNPFKGETLIGFNLPEEAEATIRISDVSGRTLKVIRGDFAKGVNQVSVNSKELPAVGVLYYTLETRDFTATKKMIIVE